MKIIKYITFDEMKQDLSLIINNLKTRSDDDEQLKSNFLENLAHILRQKITDEQKIYLMANLAGEVKAILKTSQFNFEFASYHEKMDVFEKLVKLREVIE